jgi:hypothetical protein
MESSGKFGSFGRPCPGYDMLDWRTIVCLYRRVKMPNKKPNPNAIATAEVGLRLIASSA